MESAENSRQEEAYRTGGELTLVDVSVIADELVLDTVPSAPQQLSKAKSGGGYTIELFRDEAQVTATELLYGENRYFLGDIDALQILKLQRKRSVIQKKLSSFLAGMLIAFGLVLVFGPLFWVIRVLGLVLTLMSIGYIVYFNWWIEQRGRGEFGLLMTTKFNTKVVITSHSLKAIQALYQIVFGRLDGGNLNSEPLTVNMYTGDTIGYS